LSVLRPGSGGISLRGCDAKAFNKGSSGLAHMRLEQLARALAVAALDGVENCPVLGI
jgi:hypothetical protein